MTLDVDKTRIANATTETEEEIEITPESALALSRSVLAEGSKLGLSAAEKMELFYRRAGLMDWLRQSAIDATGQAQKELAKTNKTQ